MEDIEFQRKLCGRNKIAIPLFWSRLGGAPPLEGKTVLDVGCGDGTLVIDMALRGAKQSLGIDINPKQIEVANWNLRKNYPHLKSVVQFRTQEVTALDQSEFDDITAKNTFEHILNLDECLVTMRNILRPGGRIYIGFAPLYHCVTGDHGRFKMPIPWGHVIFSENYLLKRLKRLEPKTKVTSVRDMHLNQLTVHDFKRLFHESGLKVVFYKVNVSERKLIRLFNILRKLPFAEKYFTYSMYCILEKPNFALVLWMASFVLPSLMTLDC
jgi:2-polyprenyl-3-methyl-5-hydroxy-6-metoxy-1,4-benzoquinol methylase